MFRTTFIPILVGIIVVNGVLADDEKPEVKDQVPYMARVESCGG